MTKESTIHALDSIIVQVKEVIRESPQILGETPTLEEIFGYASAMSNLNLVLAELDWAKRHLKGGEPTWPIPKT